MSSWRVTKTLLLLFQGTPGAARPVADGGAYAPDYVPPTARSYRSRGRVRLRGHASVPLAVVADTYRSVGRLSLPLLAPIGRSAYGSVARTTGRLVPRGLATAVRGAATTVRAKAPRLVAQGQSRHADGRVYVARGRMPGALDPAHLAAWRQRSEQELAALYLFLTRGTDGQ